MIFGIISSLLAIALLLGLSNELGHQAGHAKGYAKGRKDADNWWLGVEAEADQARQQIWREEEKRG